MNEWVLVITYQNRQDSMIKQSVVTSLRDVYPDKNANVKRNKKKKQLFESPLSIHQGPDELKAICLFPAMLI